MPGPLPERNRLGHQGPPKIPMTNLPASGRPGRAPTVPSWVILGKAGKAWWRWAWSTPQACGWGTGAGQESMVARRASLEDDLAALERVQGLDLVAALAAFHSATELAMVIRRVAALATGRLGIVKEMRELDDRLGLTPRGLAQLRWIIIDDVPIEEVESGPDDENVADLDERRRRILDAS